MMPQLTTLLQIFLESLLYSTVNSKSHIDPDDSLLETQIK